MKKYKALLGLAVLVITILSITGCSKTKIQPENQSESQSETQPEESIVGEIAVSGSTSVEKIGNAVGEEFKAINPGVTFSYEAIGSSAGIKNAHEGITPIGASSRNLKDEEKKWGLKEVAIAFDGIAVITHPENTVKGLTLDQITAIYKGEITNWSEVGGQDKSIVVVSREDGSGTRGAFEELLGFEKQLTESALIAEGNGNVQTTVAGNPQAIGYVSLTSINDTVKALLVDEVEATIDNVISESYKISRPFLMVYYEENINTAAKAYIEFILSEEGQSIVKENGGIPIN